MHGLNWIWMNGEKKQNCQTIRMWNARAQYSHTLRGNDRIEYNRDLIFIESKFFISGWIVFFSFLRHKHPNKNQKSKWCWWWIFFFCTLLENKVDGYAIYFILVIGNDSTKNFILMLSTIIINQVKFVCYIWRIFCYTHIIWMLESIVCILTRDNFSSASMHFFLTSISRYFFAVNPS